MKKILAMDTMVKVLGFSSWLLMLSFKPSPVKIQL